MIQTGAENTLSQHEASLNPVDSVYAKKESGENETDTDDDDEEISSKKHDLNERLIEIETSQEDIKTNQSTQ